ncbi:protein NETWORKED 4B [Salix suchowensis]|nr:protein NETWORKED 4B [Salix suchowensis]
MASSMVLSKNYKRSQSRKSNSWWWDSHISLKNSKWLNENLEEMDQNVKRMLKLIEDDGDSFVKKAEMYYQKRPELISHVEEFYRMYRSLAERYDHGSGISDIVSESPSPVREQKLSRRKSGPRAAGDHHQKEGDESSTLTDSESESDDSSRDQALSRRIIDLEIELREAKEKLRVQQDESVDGSFRGVRNGGFDDILARIAGYERDLMNANERIQVSEEEVARLNNELKKYRSSEVTEGLQSEFSLSTEIKVVTREDELEPEINQASRLQERIDRSECEAFDSNAKIQSLMEELRIANERLQVSKNEVTTLKGKLEGDGPSDKTSNLQDELAIAHREINSLKKKLNAEKREVSKLQERISRLKSSLSDRDHEARDLKIAVSDAEQKIFPEKALIKAQMSKLIEERTCLEEQLKEQESRGRSLEDDIRMFQAGKAEMEQRLDCEINNHIEKLDKSLDVLKSERDELNVKVIALKAEVTSRDEQIDQMGKHLQQLHMEHVKLIGVKDLEEEVERQRNVILERAEEKREAIRQLCLALEYYRNDYHARRQAFVGHKRVPVWQRKLGCGCNANALPTVPQCECEPWSGTQWCCNDVICFLFSSHIFRVGVE